MRVTVGLVTGLGVSACTAFWMESWTPPDYQQRGRNPRPCLRRLRSDQSSTQLRLPVPYRLWMTKHDKEDNDVSSQQEPQLPADIAGQFKILTCSATSCAKKRRDLGVDQFSTFSEFYVRAKERAPTIKVEETSCLGGCQTAPCVAIEHEDYEGTVALEGMTATEFADRVFHNVCYEQDVDRVWKAVENAVQVLAAEQNHADDNHDDENDGDHTHKDGALLDDPSSADQHDESSQLPPSDRMVIAKSTTEQQQQQKNVQEILESISDAEAVLACRAYLVKRKRWSPDEHGGWTEWARRQQAQRQTADDETTGFFWEDLSQLKFWDPLASPLRRANENAIVDAALTLNAEENGLEDDNDVVVTTRHSSDTDASEAVVGAEDTISLAAWNEAYQNDDASSAISEIIESTLTLEDPEPSPEHLRRSQAIRQKFDDPGWKKRWYESRWGNRDRRGSSEERLQQRLASVRQVATEEEMLAPLATMSEDEITQALVEYITANRKRSQRRQAWVTQNKAAKEKRRKRNMMTPKLLPHSDASHGQSTDDMLQVNANGLAEKRRTYSDRAKRAYKTRLERLSKRRRPPQSSGQQIENERHSTVVSARDYVELIELSVNNGTLPQMEWIRNAMQANESERVKKVFILLLRNFFGLKGRATLPIEGPALPLTQRSVEELGEYCSYLIRQKEAATDLEPGETYARGLWIRKHLNISTSEPENCLKLVEFCIEKKAVPLVSWIKTLAESRNTRRSKKAFLALLKQWGVASGTHWFPTDKTPLLTERSVHELGENCIHFLEMQLEAEDTGLAKRGDMSWKDMEFTVVPSVALKRIEQALEKKLLPEADWIRQAMNTGKLKGRRELFLRLLLEQFQMYGRQWLPVDGDDGFPRDTVAPFVSNRSVRDLGESCAILVRQRRMKEAETRDGCYTTWDVAR